MKKKFTTRELFAGLKTAIQSALEHKRLFVVVSIFTLLLAVIEPVIPYIFGRLVDAVISQNSIDIPMLEADVPLYAVLLCTWLIIALFQAGLMQVMLINNILLQEQSHRGYAQRAHFHSLRLPLSFHKSHKVGEYIEMVGRASSAVGHLVSVDLMNTAPNFISVVISLAIIISFSPSLFYIIAAGIIIYIIATILLVRPIVPLQRESQRLYGFARGHAVDAVMNVKSVKDFNAEEHEKEKLYDLYHRKAMPVWFSLQKRRRLLVFVQRSLNMLTRFATLAVSIYLINKGSLSVGSFVIVNMYAKSVFDPLAKLSDNWRDIQNGIIAIEDVEEILRQPAEVYEPNGSENAPRKILGKVEFRKVIFGYESERPVLRDISFTAMPGESIALVGESGVGKSSLVDLLSGYHFPQSGDIIIDDIEIRQHNLNTLRRSIGVVTQEITLFNDTIRNNIAYGNFERSDAEIQAAARKAHCYDFIEKFPHKWEQQVGERGLKLSVGQKQRVAIARAILKNPHILILDEPTSALDATSEKIITESLDELMKGKTTFIVAHRLSTVRKADKILVFKNGMIIEEGNHAKLIKIPGGEYRRLYELQIGLE